MAFLGLYAYRHNSHTTHEKNFCLDFYNQIKHEVKIHLHGTFIDNELEKAFGGHLIEAKVIEVKVDVLSEEKITRKLDERVTVKLLNLPPYLTTQISSSQKAQNNSNSFPLGLAIPLVIIIFGLLAMIMFWTAVKNKK